MPKTEKYVVDIKGEEYTIPVILPTKEENLYSLDKYPLYIATIDYFATGEGSSQYVLIKRASNEDEFCQWANENSDAYYMSGARIYKNMIPEADGPFDFLISPRIRNFLTRVLSGEQDSGYFVYTSRSYMNFS